jgi:hypothetical protein
VYEDSGICDGFGAEFGGLLNYEFVKCYVIYVLGRPFIDFIADQYMLL